MNIFETHQGIVGRADAEGMARVLSEFFELAQEIRGKLGARAYLLDKYISYLLESANKTLCNEAADQGFMSGGVVRRICHEALCGKDGEHPIFERARAYLSERPIPYQELETRIDILMIAMMDEYVKTATDLFLEDQEYALLAVVDVVHVRQLYQEISDLLGSETLMEKLNLLIRQRFFAVPVMAAYTQGLTNDLLYCLIHRDIETNKQVFQLILEHGFRVWSAGDA